jgi:hypothetical protein
MEEQTAIGWQQLFNGCITLQWQCRQDMFLHAHALTLALIVHSKHCLRSGRTSFVYGTTVTLRSTAMTSYLRTKLATDASLQKWSYFTPNKIKSLQLTPISSLTTQISSGDLSLGVNHHPYSKLDICVETNHAH